jgi:hypothetical protein
MVGFWPTLSKKVSLYRRAYILRAAGAKIIWGDSSSGGELTGDFLVELKAHRMAIAACFVFRREISRSVFWDFFDSIGRKQPRPSGANPARLMTP